MLLLEYMPRIFLTSRTTLIPKTKDNLHLCKNWRPISHFIFSRILNRVWVHIFLDIFKAIQLNPMQREFTDIDGCLANNLTFESFIKSARKKRHPYNIISLDLSKAFDRISHHSIKRDSLKRFAIDDSVINTNIECL